jgi:hypothetical protein
MAHGRGGGTPKTRAERGGWWQEVPRRRRHLWRRHLPQVMAVGCGSLFLGLLGSAAGVMWSLALGVGAGAGAMYGGLALVVVGLLLIPANARAGSSVPTGFVLTTLLLFLMALGSLFWIVGVIER